ncbi:hypothetical protein A3H11_03730 [Candidatus Uhrbacteria bacterium RIFCSPLOWO2_12_FULL_47_10]|nr:MAG: hypothetical protein A3H11_03730 [Candidatus Uhrbacteria bacterium RIFCSPLOWO2_12_FULL_47_10]
MIEMNLMRVQFTQLFRRNENGALTPLSPVNINGIVFGPGVSFGPGVVFGGVNLFDFVNDAIEADQINGVWVIRGFYKNQ